MLEVEMKTTIKTLHLKGYNKTQIGQMLNIDRKTVRKVLRSEEGCKEDKQTGRGVWPSVLDKHMEYISTQIAKGISITRIHQGLSTDYGVSCAYTTVRDYVSKIRKTQPEAYMVLFSLPGEEAQVDFGYIGTINVNGKPRKAWVFVMSLSYSRYMYVQITLSQSVRDFILCHARAFRYFGGVPQSVKIDNLKAAIIEADFYEPTVQRTYAEFAKHYGFLPDPCRVYTPTDKGKVESNVKYVKDNCFKGRDFKDIREAEEFLAGWLEGTANRRTHGTTKKIPAEQFRLSEKVKLKKLPDEDFIFSKSSTATVRADCHIVYCGNYYSVPCTHIGMEVDLIEVNRLLRIYYKGKEIALHGMLENVKGEHSTDKGHYPHSKTVTHDEMMSGYQDKMREIGKGALRFFEAFRDADAYRVNQYRSIAGILSLRKRYGDEAVDTSCARACHYGNITYRAVKKICSSGLYSLPLEEKRDDAQPCSGRIRELSAYRDMTGLGVITHE